MEKQRVVAKKVYRVMLRLSGRSLTFGAIAVFAVLGVFTFEVGYAISPVLPEETIRQNHFEKLALATPAPTAPAAPVTTAASLVSAPAPISAPVPLATVPARQWSVASLYVHPATDAANQARAWASSRPADAGLMARIAAQPQAMWFGGWNANVRQDVNAYVSAAAAAGRMPVLVAYNIPARDCGSYSAGGATAAAEYNAWIQQMADGIAGRPAVVIVEPDALPMLTTPNCLDQAGQNARLTMLSRAVTTLKAGRMTHVYLDAGNPGWQTTATMASRLSQAGVGAADGFALNISNFYRTPELVAYGTQLSRQVGGKHFVLDVSRNGNGVYSNVDYPHYDWCNPPGRAIGSVPTTATGNSLIDALLWIKIPGQSDGFDPDPKKCFGGPSAGTWWPEYALGLARAKTDW